MHNAGNLTETQQLALAQVLSQISQTSLNEANQSRTPTIPTDQLIHTLSEFNWNVDATITYLSDVSIASQDFWQWSVPSESLGMENAGNTCYIGMLSLHSLHETVFVFFLCGTSSVVEWIPCSLPIIDSLLFAMFSHPSLYDTLLLRQIQLLPSNTAISAGKEKSSTASVATSTASRKALQVSLRLIINAFRQPKLVTLPYIRNLLKSLSLSGWHHKGQSDVSEFYLFLMDKLAAPFLPLQEIIMHGGKPEPRSGDEKLSTLRVLTISIPETSSSHQSLVGRVLNRIKSTSSPALTRSQSSTSIESLDWDLPQLIKVNFVNLVEVEREVEIQKDPAYEHEFTLKNLKESCQKTGVLIDFGDEGSIHISDSDPKHEKGQKFGISSAKQKIKGWSTIALYPFLSAVNELGESIDHHQGQPIRSAEDMTRFPIIVPIILKRYTATGHKLQVKIQIPMVLDTTGFVLDDGTGQTYQLHLKGLVCHLGTEMGQGHYISYAPSKATSSSTLSISTPTHWLRFDDLSSPRVRPIPNDDKHQSEMQTEWAQKAYMLFYELIPVDLITPSAPTNNQDWEFAMLLQQKEWRAIGDDGPSCSVM